MKIPFHNTYINLPDNFYSKAAPAQFPNPQLIVFNEGLAKSLGIDWDQNNPQELAQVFSGQKIIEGCQPLAMAYAGFQFGHPVAQLGDGRALLLGEVKGYDLQLKGSGQTPYSRRGDGRSELGPVIREYLVSEAMHALGVPTTRALAAVSTGEIIQRQFGPGPGGVFTRVAESHIRVGTFQYFAFQKDLESIEILLKYTISRHYPEIDPETPIPEMAIEMLKLFTQRQAGLIAQWLGYGFIHGVMNTDNFSLAAITLDYGPCAFMDEYREDQVFSSIDQHGRYAYSNQILIAKWNILRLCDCLLPLIDLDQTKAIDRIEEYILPLFSLFEEKKNEVFAKKMGIKLNDSSANMIEKFLSYIEKEKLDFTLAFRNLEDLIKRDYRFYKETSELHDFLDHWRPISSEFKKVNPQYIPRNHLIQKAIDQAYEADYSFFNELLQHLTQPFSPLDLPLDEFSIPVTDKDRIHHTYCGT